MAAGLQSGWAPRRRAATPETCGQDMEVPEIMLYATLLESMSRFVGLAASVHAANMLMPGAITSGFRISGVRIMPAPPAILTAVPFSTRALPPRSQSTILPAAFDESRYPERHSRDPRLPAYTREGYSFINIPVAKDNIGGEFAIEGGSPDGYNPRRDVYRGVGIGAGVACGAGYYNAVTGGAEGANGYRVAGGIGEGARGVESGGGSGEGGISVERSRGRGDAGVEDGDDDGRGVGGERPDARGGREVQEGRGVGGVERARTVVDDREDMGEAAEGGSLVTVRCDGGGEEKYEEEGDNGFKGDVFIHRFIPTTDRRSCGVRVKARLGSGILTGSNGEEDGKRILELPRARCLESGEWLLSLSGPTGTLS
ncbi:hypothetical protein M5K25_012611 [Dendrobium thyrsiflorum]|uniref:Uncharacterized protein n=1 Tax=Dendrobium thyrsiflorum TaxID=117978 RepID=A0ABD0UXM4_DENTH